MRLAGIDAIKPNTVLGRNVYNGEGRLLLRQGVPLKSEYLTKMKSLGYFGTFVDDAVSSDVDIPDIIPEGLRRDAVNAIKTICEAGLKNPQQFPILVNKAKKLVDDIIDEVVANRDDILNLRDLKTIDEYLYQHSVNVTVLALCLGRELGYRPDELRELGLAAILHDIGMSKIDRQIITKPGKLTDAETAEVRLHTATVYDLMKNTLRSSTVAYVTAFQHHERYDRGGYPSKRGGDELNRFSRVLTLADVYDAMTSARSYRPNYSPAEAYEYIIANGGAHFDPNVVAAFTRKIAPFAAGSTVVLSDSRHALVVENNSNFILRPIIRVIPEGDDDFTLIDLSKESLNLTIMDMV